MNGATKGTAGTVGKRRDRAGAEREATVLGVRQQCATVWRGKREGRIWASTNYICIHRSFNH